MDEIYYLVSSLLKSNKIKVDLDELKTQLISHPDYPSLYAISATLNLFEVENLAVNVPVNIETFDQLPESFLAELTIGSAKSLVLTTKFENKVRIQESDKSDEISTEEFLKIFTGVILAVEADEETAKQQKSTNKKPIFYFAYGMLGILFASMFLDVPSQLMSLAYLLSTIIGLYISVAIVKQELGMKTVIGDAFCSGKDEKSSCDDVISSSGAKISGGIKLSTMSLLYFTMALITGIVFQLIGNGFNVLFYLSVLSIPVTFYSLYYQAVVLKKWCKLCLGIVGMLYVQIAIASSVLLIGSFPLPRMANLLIALGVGIVVALGVAILVPMVEELNGLKGEKIKYMKFKRNFKMFKMNLMTSERILESATGEIVDDLIFGDKNAPLTVSVISNPLCRHCKEAHHVMDNVLQKFQGKVKFRVRFLVNTEMKDNLGMKIAEKLLEIYFQKGEKVCITEMNKVYGDASAADWLSLVGESQTDYKKMLKKESEWCYNHQINFTPEMLVDGWRFPQSYERSDLVYFIDELVEEKQIDEKELMTE